MGKIDGFLLWPRTLPERRPVTERLDDWNEIYKPQAEEMVRRQASRCIDCGVPFCQQGCPLGNHIPDWNDLVYRDRWRAAYRRLAATNNFPEFTGRLCPAPCEAACVLAINTGAVTIEEMEKEIIEHAFAHDWVVSSPPRQRTGKHVAVVGSGPAGLAAAAQLNGSGHRVTVYEAASCVGGMLRYGIPDFKMEKWVIDRRIAVMEAEGVEFVTGVNVGHSVGWDDLAGRHDALLIAIGARRPRDLEVPGRYDVDGVHLAMDYLTRQNQVVAGEIRGDESTHLDMVGKRVIILGGGDTGSDCLGTALRQGASVVHQIELFPAPGRDRGKDNPWPQWPMIYRTSSSQEEGGDRDFAIMTTRLSGQGRVLRALHAVRIEVAPDRSIRAIPDSELVIPVDALILAMGFVGPDSKRLVEQLGVALDARGNVATDADYASSVPGVFCAGDAHRGQSLIVWAIAEGREAARAVDAKLRGGAPWLPTRGVDQPFGGL